MISLGCRRLAHLRLPCQFSKPAASQPASGVLYHNFYLRRRVVFCKLRGRGRFEGNLQPDRCRAGGAVFQYLRAGWRRCAENLPWLMTRLTHMEIPNRRIRLPTACAVPAGLCRPAGHPLRHRRGGCGRSHFTASIFVAASICWPSFSVTWPMTVTFSPSGRVQMFLWNASASLPVRW